MQIDDYIHMISSDRQTYTEKEIGIPGIRLFGHLINTKAHGRLFMHEHEDCIEICYIAKGNQVYMTDDTEFILTGNTVFITYPGECHGTGENPEGKLELYWIQLNMNRKNFLSLSKTLCEKFKYTLLNMKNHKLIFNENLKYLLDSAFNCITKENASEKLSGLSYLILFLNKLIEADNASPKQISEKISEVKAYIEKNISEHLSLSQLADYAGLSLSHFKKRFKLETGETPGDFINFLKIQKAKEMLKNKNICITDVAYALDFCSSAYFSSVFRHYAGMSPKEYRKTIL